VHFALVWDSRSSVPNELFVCSN